MIFNYSNFRKDTRINENVAGAKKILKDTFILNRAVNQVSKMNTDKTGMILLDKDDQPIRFEKLPEEIKSESKKKFREIKLSEAELRDIERNPKFAEIRNLLGDKLGYAQLFTYLHIKELTPMEELKNILSGLIEYSDLLPKLRRPISNYIDPNISNNAEQIVDDIEELKRWRKLKKFIDEFTSDLKKDYSTSPPFFKNKLVDIAAAFDELGKDSESGKIDAEKQRSIQKRFFDKIRRYKTVRELIAAAELFLKSEANADTSKFYLAIENCNKKYGSYGVNVLYDEGGLIIMEVKSFSACKELFSNTSWCIASSLHQWNSYVGGDTVFTKQYSIMNFNLPPSEDKSIVGITIEPGQKVRACHLKSDANAMGTFRQIFNQFEKELGLTKDFIWSGLEPMSKEEIEIKKKRIIANREIIKKGLTLAQMKKFVVDDGADVNASTGEALHNAVIEADPASEKYGEAKEKIKFLLDYGASPNLRSESDSTVDKVKSFEVLKMLLEKGAAITKPAFKSISDDLDAVKFAMDNGLKADFANGMPMRMAIKKNRLDILKMLMEEYGGGDSTRKPRDVKTAAEYGNFEILDYLLSKDVEYTKKFNDVMHWVSSSQSLKKDELDAILTKLQKYIDDGKVSYEKEGYKIGTKRMTYDEVVAKYGSLKNFYMELSK